VTEKGGHCRFPFQRPGRDLAGIGYPRIQLESAVTAGADLLLPILIADSAINRQRQAAKPPTFAAATDKVEGQVPGDRC
jgi:hypothetical protein